MKGYIHARLGDAEKDILQELKQTTGETESSLVKRGLRLVYEERVKKAKSALQIAGKGVGRFSSKLGDLSVNKKHLEGYGK